MFVQYVVVLCVGVIGLTGCASHNIDAVWPEPRPLGADTPAFQAPEDPTARGPVVKSIQEPTGALALRDAIALALVGNPELAAFSWNVRAQEALALQAGLRPNPELEFEMENFAGTGALKGFDVTETTILLGQLFELGGKRGKRQELATLTRNLSAWDYETKRLDVYVDVAKSFVNVVAAQEHVALSTELVDLAQEAVARVGARVAAGKDSPVEETKATVTLHTTRLGLERAKRDLEGARKQLAALWGSGLPAFGRAEGDIEEIVPLPAADRLAELTAENPNIARWATEFEERRAAVELADAGKIPDLTVVLGGKHLSEIGESAFVVGLAIPIPLFNRNQGETLAARYRLAQAQAEARAARAQADAALAETYRALSTAHVVATALRDEVLPAAQSAYDTTNEGYRLGKFGFLDLLDAQRTLFEAKKEYINALAAYHRASADMERLIGRALDTVTHTR
jgi:cobalt-zinc-cadmium efflux system outer membrane protein